MSGNEISLSAKLGPVVVSAGRRVDPLGAETPRFPLQNVPGVRAKVEGYLQQQRPSAIVSSAACGADLIVLQAARRAQIRCHVLLPSSPEDFRKSSVTDRPGDWGPVYDEILANSTIEIRQVSSGHEGYLEVNRSLFDKAQLLAAELGTSVAVLVIWNGQSRGQDDVTAHFRTEASRLNLPITEIPTL